MNGHFFRMERNKTYYKKTLCTMCKKIVDATECEGCKMTLCRNHWQGNRCQSEFGVRMLKQLKDNLVDLEDD